MLEPDIEETVKETVEETVKETVKETVEETVETLENCIKIPESVDTDCEDSDSDTESYIVCPIEEYRENVYIKQWYNSFYQ